MAGLSSDDVAELYKGILPAPTRSREFTTTTIDLGPLASKSYKPPAKTSPSTVYFDSPGVDYGYNAATGAYEEKRPGQAYASVKAPNFGRAAQMARARVAASKDTEIINAALAAIEEAAPGKDSEPEMEGMSFLPDSEPSKSTAKSSSAPALQGAPDNSIGGFVSSILNGLLPAADAGARAGMSTKSASAQAFDAEVARLDAVTNASKGKPQAGYTNTAFGKELTSSIPKKLLASERYRTGR